MANMDKSSPSTYDQEDWIFATNDTDQNNKVTELNTGKWMIFLPFSEVDEAWHKVKMATEEGKLGYASKVSTRKPSLFSNKQAVICVYTYDWNDEEDVMRVRGVLRELGHEKKLSYKTDEDSRAGKYAVHGHKKFCKYVC